MYMGMKPMSRQERISCRMRRRSIELSMPAVVDVVLPHTSQTFTLLWQEVIMSKCELKTNWRLCGTAKVFHISYMYDHQV